MYLSCFYVMLLICKHILKDNCLLETKSLKLELEKKNEQAFDSVDRETLWKILRLYGIPKKKPSSH